MKADEGPICSSWKDIDEWIASFPPPEMSLTDIGVDAKVWAFRGHESSSYRLQPTIEREARGKSMGWTALEHLVTSEFKARSDRSTTPSSPGDELTWLANMQHYGVPTRLLDFSYSPYVALYFATSQAQEKRRRERLEDDNKGGHSQYLQLQAIDTIALNASFVHVVGEVNREEARQSGASIKAESESQNPAVAEIRLDSFATDREVVAAEIEFVREMAAALLAGDSWSLLKRKGCACFLVPHTFNARLASQQGLFLMNCAGELPLEESLTKMMEGRREWRRKTRIPVDLVPEIEGRLFQMNIHHRSLFPDIEGLAGLIHQKVRLQWK